MESDTTTIRGIVIPVSWDEKGLVLTIAIATDSEDIYLIEDSPSGRVLNTFLRQKVTVAGSIKQIGKDRIITVSVFQPDARNESNRSNAITDV